MNIKKLIALGLATTLCASLLGGCGAEPESSSTTGTSTPSSTETPTSNLVTEITEPVEIVFWHAMNGKHEEALTALTTEFTTANPNITVTLQNQGSYADLSQKLTTTAISPKDLPTMTQAYPDWMLNPIADELVLDLKPFIDDATIGFADYEDINESFRAVTTMDGKIYGMPFNKSTEVIWYNKTMFEELGLVAPTTYEELVTVSKTIFEKKGIAGAGFDSLSNYYTAFLKNEGIAFDSTTDVTGEASVKAANYYLDGVKEGYFRIAGTDKYLSGPFAAGQVGMYMGSNAGESYVVDGVDGKFEIGVARYPAKHAMQQGTDIYMFSNSSPEEQTAAYLYMTFLLSTENQITWGISTGYIPARTAAVSAEAYKNSGSLVATTLDTATTNMFTNPLTTGSESAYRESASVLEGILASPEAANVEEALKAYSTTLLDTWAN